MKRGSTHFLRFVVFLLGIVALALCVFALPAMHAGASAEFPYASSAILVIIFLLGASAVPFFFALWETLKLLRSIDLNTAFSESSVKALNTIKYCAIVMAGLWLACVPFLYPIAEIDDAPGLLLIGGALACTPLIIAVFAAVLQKLLQSAIALKSENDLTV